MIKKSLLIWVGLLLIAAALLLIGYNLWTNHQAEIASEEALNELLSQIQENAASAAVPTAPPEIEEPEIEVPETEETPIEVPEEEEEQPEPEEEEQPEEQEAQVLTLSTGSYIGILSIPALSRVLPVVSEVSNINLKIAPCLYSGSLDQGNMVICAHNYTSHFGTLKNLQAGDEVVFTDLSGVEHRYAVTEIETLQPTDIYEMVFKDCDLTLFTCTVGGQSRVTVRCDRMD